MTGNELRQIRREILRLEQAELAARLEIHKNTIGLYERGLQPIPMQTALAVAWLCMFGPGDPFAPHWRPRLLNLKGQDDG